MPEPLLYTGEMIDAAWQEALDANSAFDRYKAAETRLDRVREVAGFAITGITIEDGVLTTLEDDLADAQATFEGHMNTESPLMVAPDSPFRLAAAQMDGSAIVRAAQIEQASRTIEQITDRESPVCDDDELYAFAELRGYRKETAGRAHYLLSREGEIIEVDNLSDYASPVDDSAEGFGQLRTLVYEIDGKRRYAHDKTGILYNVSKWVAAKPDIKGLGVTLISFLADYCNHAFPDLERPLPVTHPPALKATAEAKAAAEVAKLRELGLRELLLDKVDLYDEGEVEVVTDHSLKRHALTLGYTASSAPQYAKLFQSMKRRMARGEYPRQGVSRPHRINDWLIYTGGSEEYGPGTTWGIPPNAFREIIDSFESSSESRRYIECYTDFTRSVLRQYLEALESIT